MTLISDISFTLTITDFTGKPEHRAEALYVDFSVSCPLYRRVGCTGKVILKRNFIGVEGTYFGMREKDFILFPHPPKELEGRVPSLGLPSLVCPECGVMFRIINLYKILDQKPREFLTDKRTVRD